MDNLRTMLDATMCLLWILTYTLVLVGTKKYQYPLISPITQGIIAPFEFAVLYRYMFKEYLSLNYVLLAYIYWTIIEIAIIVLMIQKEFIKKKHVAQYLISISAITCIMCYLVAYKGHMFFFSYFNTFIGEIIWLQHILKRDYPMKFITLLIFVAKFIGDAIAIPVYFATGPWMISIICALLPILDFIFIIIYFLRKHEYKTFGSRSRK